MNNRNINRIVSSISIRERSDGRLEGRLPPEFGRKSFYGKTATEIKNKAKDFLKEDSKKTLTSDKTTLSEFVEYWFRYYKYNKIEPSSLSRLYNVYAYQIRHVLGNKKISLITSDEIQEMIDNYSNPPEDEDIVPITYSSLKKIMEVLDPTFEVAVIKGLVNFNPCRFVVMPKEDLMAKPTRIPKNMNDVELEIFKNAVLNKFKVRDEYRSRDGICLMIILNTGLRIGEFLALEWDDIDLEKGLIRINKTLQCFSTAYDPLKNDGKRNVVRLKNSAKTRCGNRLIPINDTILYYINELKKYDERNGIQSKYVACTKNGTRVDYQNFRRSMKRLLKNTSLTELTLHDLRHTFGSTLLRKKVPIEIVSKLMGHSKISITYNIYIHVLEEDNIEALKTVDVYS